MAHCNRSSVAYVNALLALASAALLMTATSTSVAAFEDPTDQLIPSVECEAQTCRDATEAIDAAEYARAGDLFMSHFDERSADDDVDGAWLVYAAYAHQRAGDYDEAAELYSRAADSIDPLRDYLLVQATRATMQGERSDDIFDRALSNQALRAGFADGYFLEARIDHLRQTPLDSELVEQALDADDTDEICPWLVDIVTDSDDPETGLFELAYSRCVDEEHLEAVDALDLDASAAARLRRGEALAADVRFEEALQELSAIDTDELSNHELCRAQFRKARSHFRLRRRRAAEDLYREIIADCTDDASEDERVRSLYGLGNRMYQRGRLDESETAFQTLFDEYPHRSHADDALMFLARIERQRDDHDQEREIDLLIEALENYPHEDMIHEMAWEVYEPTFRSGDYREFIDAVTRLPLPDWDQEYFSQGRLEYFVGLAHERLGEYDDAENYWQLAWVKYPFSFYGYLANLKLVEHDRTPESLYALDEAESVPWFADGFEGSGADILARADHLEGACDFERAQLDSGASRSERWRVATLCHQAGEYPVSHNIARRQISGRPWAAPASGRMARWHIAWPDPFADELRQAVDEFGPDGERAIDPGLASSIMREESAFYEDIISWAGAIGLMQLMPQTATDHDDVIDGQATPDRLEKAEVNIPVGIDHIALLSRNYDGHPVAIVAAYNAGGGRINSWLRRQPNDEIALWVEDIPILQTRNYTKRVIGSYAAYQYLRGVTELDDRVANPAR